MHFGATPLDSTDRLAGREASHGDCRFVPVTLLEQTAKHGRAEQADKAPLHWSSGLRWQGDLETADPCTAYTSTWGMHRLTVSVPALAACTLDLHSISNLRQVADYR